MTDKRFWYKIYFDIISAGGALMLDTAGGFTQDGEVGESVIKLKWNHNEKIFVLLKYCMK